jgi:hypothetical protein
MNRENSWLAPLTGVLFVVVVIVAFVISGEPPEVDEPAQEIVDFYVDNQDMVIVGVILEGIAATLFVLFGGYVRRVLRDAEGERGILSAVAFAGTIIFAVGLAIDGTISIALAETAEDIDPGAVQALAALWQHDFIPFAVGIQVFLLAMGLSAVRTGAIPKWIGWIAILLALIAVTPIGFAAFLGAGVLVIVLSVVLTMRARATPPRA